MSQYIFPFDFVPFAYFELTDKNAETPPLPLFFFNNIEATPMISLVQDAIKTMGKPETATKETEKTASEPAPVSSISLGNSFRDWWKSSADLKTPTSHSAEEKESVRTTKAKAKNRKIEYDLFRAILSEDIYLQPPPEPTLSGVEVSEATKPDSSTSHKYFGQQLDVQLENNVTIHEFYLQNNEEVTDGEDPLHIVFIHGYMAAIGYFIKNLEPLLKSKPGIRIHLIDLPGFGNSSRQKFPDNLLYDKPEKIEDKIKQVVQAESWFIDKIEEWRLKRNLSHFKIIAHSMGAYLSACYLMKYNQKMIVDQFMLVSPMGTESSHVSLINEKKFQYNHHDENLANDPFRELTDVVDPEEYSKIWEELGQPKFPKNFVLENLWKHQKSPFQLLQMFGPFYSKVLSYWSFKRFANVKSNDEEQHESDSSSTASSGSSTDLILKLHNYSFSIFNQFQGSGELAIAKFVSHEILPRLPLCDRGFCEYILESKVEIAVVYGDKDWMNAKGGEYMHNKISDTDDKLSKYKVIESAGHHIYLDNPALFNEYCKDFFGLGSKSS